MLTVIACWGVNWLLGSPMETSTAREGAVVVQVVVAAALAMWCWRRSATLERDAARDLAAAA